MLQGEWVSVPITGISTSPGRERRAQPREAFAHPDQAEAASGSRPHAVRIEANAIILNRTVKEIAFAADADRDARRPGVPRNVGQCLLNGPVRDVLDCR